MTWHEGWDVRAAWSHSACQLGEERSAAQAVASREPVQDLDPLPNGPVQVTALSASRLWLSMAGELDAGDYGSAPVEVDVELTHEQARALAERITSLLDGSES